MAGYSEDITQNFYNWKSLRDRFYVKPEEEACTAAALNNWNTAYGRGFFFANAFGCRRCSNETRLRVEWRPLCKRKGFSIHMMARPARMKAQQLLASVAAYVTHPANNLKLAIPQERRANMYDLDVPASSHRQAAGARDEVVNELEPRSRFDTTYRQRDLWIQLQPLDHVEQIRNGNEMNGRAKGHMDEKEGRTGKTSLQTTNRTCCLKRVDGNTRPAESRSTQSSLQEAPNPRVNSPTAPTKSHDNEPQNEKPGSDELPGLGKRNGNSFVQKEHASMLVSTRRWYSTTSSRNTRLSHVGEDGSQGQALQQDGCAREEDTPNRAFHRWQKPGRLVGRPPQGWPALASLACRAPQSAVSTAFIDSWDWGLRRSRQKIQTSPTYERAFTDMTRPVYDIQRIAGGISSFLKFDAEDW
ncbi:hypothetical protein K505DRAFT_333965 [Melanomma pulvis-pyrius CBS 109.77]|uniref:Uncharacterized protein n=1 Tax=Melanomma pulvis-pyrius CBS 109.77 TaxID=1314802 RepID=A0A6A6XNU5_9PLEO|nr:hypothetical protein K505DRAFT_333965 [Melanomma pulvis-pyrius CBS 109.77]